MMLFYVPEDRDLLSAFGELSLRHEHLVHILRMTIKTLADLDVNEALDATAFESASSLRERIKKLARQRLGEGKPLLQVQALVERCRQVSEKRNRFVHSVWAKQVDGEPQLRANDREWRELPSVQELRTLSQDLQALTQQINQARLEGFLAEAFKSRPLTKPQS